MSSPCSRTVPAVGAEDAQDAVEEGRLAGSVGADQPDPLALLHGEVEVVQGDDPREALVHGGGLEHGGHVTASSAGRSESSASVARRSRHHAMIWSVRRAALRLPCSTRPSG